MCYDQIFEISRNWIVTKKRNRIKIKQNIDIVGNTVKFYNTNVKIASYLQMGKMAGIQKNTNKWRPGSTLLCDSASPKHFPTLTGTWQKKRKMGQYKNIVGKQHNCRLSLLLSPNRVPQLSFNLYEVLIDSSMIAYPCSP